MPGAPFEHRAKRQTRWVLLVGLVLAAAGTAWVRYQRQVRELDKLDRQLQLMSKPDPALERRRQERAELELRQTARDEAEADWEAIVAKAYATDAGVATRPDDSTKRAPGAR